MMILGKQRYWIADALVGLANRLVKGSGTPASWPRYRIVDSPNERITGSKWACAAYSYENLKSLVKQYEDDGLPPVTVAWLISDEGWVEITPENMQEVRRALAISGIDLDDGAES